MLRGIPVLKPYVNLQLHELDNQKIKMTLKSAKSGFKKENVNPNDYVHCCVVGCHGNSLLHFGLNTKVSCEELLRGG